MERELFTIKQADYCRARTALVTYYYSDSGTTSDLITHYYVCSTDAKPEQTDALLADQQDFFEAMSAADGY